METTKYIVHYVTYDDYKRRTVTYRKIESAIEFLTTARNVLRDCFKDNGMKFHDGSNITEDSLIWIINEQCHIEKQIVSSERLDY